MKLTVRSQPVDDWNTQVARLPGCHFFQTTQWAQVKLRTGWQALYCTWRDESGRTAAAALVLIRALTFGGLSVPLRVMYLPKGPLLDWSDPSLARQVLEDLQSQARQRGAIFLKIDPDVRLGCGLPGEPDAREDPSGSALQERLGEAGWVYSGEQVQFRNTVLLDLTQSEDELLRRMKQKARYNIRLAERKGVTVRPGAPADFGLLYRMYAETSMRDGFVIRDESYYQHVWDTFMRAGMAEPLIAEVEGQPVAAVVIFRFAGKATYLYGMSRQEHREKMPNHLLQWEAIRRARQAGCQIYDLWGAPEVFDESDPLWGVYRFKEGLGGQIVRTLGAWDYPVWPWLYRIYTQTLPRLLAVMRRRGLQRTRNELGETK
jgi:lipid II:glycine glycyltransferase (peptidoglycan interpeptide bridge formation enzyme)